MDEPSKALSELAAAFRPLTKAFADMADSYMRAWKQWAESPSGRYLLAVAKYYDEHPEELAKLEARSGVVERSCHCFCQRWDHLGTCTGRVTTSVRMDVPRAGSVDVPMCGPCASSVVSRR